MAMFCVVRLVVTRRAPTASNIPLEAVVSGRQHAYKSIIITIVITIVISTCKSINKSYLKCHDMAFNVATIKSNQFTLIGLGAEQHVRQRSIDVNQRKVDCNRL